MEPTGDPFVGSRVRQVLGRPVPGRIHPQCQTGSDDKNES
jgi:hypothetical protein